MCPEGIVQGRAAYCVLRVLHGHEALARRLWPRLFGEPGRLGMFLGQFDSGFLEHAFGGRGTSWALYRRAEACRTGRGHGPTAT